MTKAATSRRLALLSLAGLMAAGCAQMAGAPLQTTAPLSQPPAAQPAHAVPPAPGAEAASPSPAGTIDDPDAARIARIANAATKANNYSLAVQLYREAVRRAPDEPALLLPFADLLLAANALSDAEEAYRAVLARAPQERSALLGLAKVCIALGQPQDARQRFQQVLARDGTDRTALNGLAITYDLMGEHRAAQQQYQRALGLYPTDPSLRANYGLSLTLSGNAEQGLALLEEVSRDPDATPAHRHSLALARDLAGADARHDTSLEAVNPSVALTGEGSGLPVIRPTERGDRNAAPATATRSHGILIRRALATEQAPDSPELVPEAGAASVAFDRRAP